MTSPSETEIHKRIKKETFDEEKSFTYNEKFLKEYWIQNMTLTIDTKNIGSAESPSGFPPIVWIAFPMEYWNKLWCSSLNILSRSI